MSTISNITNDYLKPPTNSGVIDSTKPRAATYAEYSNEHEEHVRSRFCPSPTTHTILKLPNSPSRRSSTVSHLSVHYTPETNDDKEKVEVISTLDAPEMETTPLGDRKPGKNQRYYLKIPTHVGFRNLLLKSSEPHSFLPKRYGEKQILSCTIQPRAQKSKNQYFILVIEVEHMFFIFVRSYIFMNNIAQIY